MNSKKYFIITIGCQMNKSDSERIAFYLENLGFAQANNASKADLVVLATCGVRQSAEDRIYGLVPKIKKENKKTKIVLAGCLSEREDVQKRLAGKVDIWLPIVELSSLAKRLGLKYKEQQIKFNDYLKIQPKYSSDFSAFVPIGNGCNNFCAYCVVPFARGREVYRPVKDIIDEIKDLVKRGYKEIILIAQNVNSYASNLDFKKNNVNFATLLRMVNDIEGDFWIRFATSHPKDMSDGLIKAVAKCDKACEHIHLAAQAGDNEILRAMKRKYSREHYLDLIKKIRTAVPDASITTDIIVGFPNETKKQFQNTVKLFKEAKFDMAYIARYSPRPGTAAIRLKDNVLSKEKKEREEKLMKVLRETALENNKKYLNKIVEVLVKGINKKGEFYGKTRTNKNVKIKIKADGLKAKDLTGKFIKIKIKSIRDFGLSGKIIK